MLVPYFGDIRSKIVERLESAEQSIRIAMAWFTNGVLFQVILNKAAAGVKVALILSDSEANFRKGNSLNFEKLQRKGASVAVMAGDGGRFMHHKFVVIDSKEVLTGSYNWSNNAQTNYENALRIEDEAVAKVYTLQFEELLKNEAAVSLDDFKQKFTVSPTTIMEQTDAGLFQLAQEFNHSVDVAMQEAEGLHAGLHMDIVNDLIRRYTAVGAARKLSNDDEQSGFVKLVSRNRSDLTFEYLTAKSRFAPLFDKTTVKNARNKLRKYLGNAVDNL